MAQAIITAADGANSVTGTYVSFAVLILGAFSTAYGVFTTVRGKKRELELEASKVDREDFNVITGKYDELAERWEKQARDGWAREELQQAELLKLKVRDSDKDEIIRVMQLRLDAQERTIVILKEELIEEKKRSLKCQERLDVIEGKDIHG